MIDNVEVLITQIRGFIADEDADKLKELVDNIGHYCYKESNDGQTFNKKLFNLIVEMMGQTQFLKMQGSYRLLMLFDFDWAMLNPMQKDNCSVLLNVHTTDLTIGWRVMYWPNCWETIFVMRLLLGSSVNWLSHQRKLLVPFCQWLLNI
jgi:hypothetical protein